MGRPMDRYSFKRAGSSRKAAASGRSLGYFRIIYSTHSTTDTAWEITVAMATPGTSQWKAMTKTRSSATFNRLHRIRKYRGVLESPMARSTADTPL